MSNIDQFLKSLENLNQPERVSALIFYAANSGRSENHAKYVDANTLLQKYFNSFCSERTAKNKRMRGEVLAEISSSIYPKIDSKFIVELILYKISKFKGKSTGIVANDVFPYFSSFNSGQLATFFFHFYAATRISPIKGPLREVILFIFMLCNTKMRKEIIKFSTEAFNKLSSRGESRMWADLICDLVQRHLKLRA